MVKIHELGFDSELQLIFVAMELVEGRDLASLLKTLRFDAGRCCRLVCDVADALAAVHAAKVLHRDVKPANIMLTRTAKDGVACARCAAASPFASKLRAHCSPSTTTVLGMSSRRGMFGFGSSGPMGFHTEARHPLNARNTTRDEPRMG